MSRRNNRPDHILRRTASADIGLGRSAASSRRGGSTAVWQGFPLHI